MATSYKAVAIAQQLLAALNARGPLTYTLGQASDGYPTLTTGAGTTGTQSIAIKVINYLAKQNAAAVTATAPVPYLDSLGLNASPFSPTVILVSLEQLSGNTGTVYVKPVNLGPVLAEAAKTGADVQILLTANTTPPTPGAGTFASDLGDIWNPGTGSN